MSCNKAPIVYIESKTWVGLGKHVIVGYKLD